MSETDRPGILLNLQIDGLLCLKTSLLNVQERQNKLIKITTHVYVYVFVHVQVYVYVYEFDVSRLAWMFRHIRQSDSIS